MFGLKSVWKNLLVKTRIETSQVNSKAGQLPGLQQVFAQRNFWTDFVLFQFPMDTGLKLGCIRYKDNVL